MPGRLLLKADFERALSVPPCSRSTHFAIHHVGRCLAIPAAAAKVAVVNELSTSLSTPVAPAVDDLGCESLLGLVVPKRHARRAVTRNLIKRQVRAAGQRHEQAFEPGLWVVRLRSVFDTKRFVSAASPALCEAVRLELDQLFVHAFKRLARA